MDQSNHYPLVNAPPHRAATARAGLINNSF
jgi:hypothetical protein